MALMLYLPTEKQAGKRLLQIMKDAVPGQKIEISHSVHTLAKRLHKPIFDISVVVLFVNKGNDLSEILKLKDFFWDLRTIIILPDADPETVTKAHILRPRYVAWANDDFSGVGMILKRLTDLYGGPNLEATEGWNAH